MNSNKAYVTSLRALRKFSHLSNKVVKKSAHFLDKVESKSTKLIINKTGSPDGMQNIAIDEILYHAFPQITPVHPALPGINQKPSVTVFAFLDPRGFYGGIATLLCVGATLANELGYDFRVAQTTGYSDTTDVLGFLDSKGIVIEKERYSTVDLSKRSYSQYAYLPLHPDDVVVVSAWWDAQIASKLPLKKKFVYLIQDFEPIFYNNSDEYVMADKTYFSEKFNPILNTSILHEFFKENGYDYIAQNGVSFEPAPKPPITKKINKKSPNSRSLFLYGRPHVHRNLYYTALEAIDIALQDPRVQNLNVNWTIYSAGSVSLPSIKLSSGNIISNLGKMDMEEYYQFASTVDVAVSPMLAPHPNYPTLEFASLGVPVVTTKWRTKQNLNTFSPNILMADATAESMAEKIVTAMLMDEATRRSNHDTTHIEGDWQSSLRPAIKKIAKTYN